MGYKTTCGTVYTHFQGITNSIYAFERPFFARSYFTRPPCLYSSIFVFSCPNDRWMDLYIKLCCHVKFAETTFGLKPVEDFRQTVPASSHVAPVRHWLNRACLSMRERTHYFWQADDLDCAVACLHWHMAADKHAYVHARQRAFMRMSTGYKRASTAVTGELFPRTIRSELAWQMSTRVMWMAQILWRVNRARTIGFSL